MPQPKNGLINLINNQGNRSDNDAPQDQCCFVVFMSFGGLDSKCGLVSRLVGPGDCVLWIDSLIRSTPGRVKPFDLSSMNVDQAFRCCWEM